jgi:hypothetical protein
MQSAGRAGAARDRGGPPGGGLRGVRDENVPSRLCNKRIGFLARVVFLDLNGYDFEAAEPDVVVEFLALADGRVSEDGLADWIRRRRSKHR